MKSDEITPTCRYNEPKCVSYEYIRIKIVAMPTQPVEKTRKELSKLDPRGRPLRVVRAQVRNAAKTRIGTAKGIQPLRVSSLTSRVSEAPDWRAANSKPYKCVSGRESR